MRTTLYRFFDVQDRLLYVGIAGRPAERAHQHSKEKEWWLEVTRSTYEHFTTREAAAAAEVAAIVTEHPLYNVVHNTKGSSPLPPALERRHNPGLTDQQTVPGGLSAAQLHAFMDALSDIANSVDSEAFTGTGQEGLARWVANMARLCCYGDWCGPCSVSSSENDPIRYPVACRVTDGWLKAAYSCHECGETWTCGWSVGAPWILS